MSSGGGVEIETRHALMLMRGRVGTGKTGHPLQAVRVGLRNDGTEKTTKQQGNKATGQRRIKERH
jgi:hypothetical protein